MTWLAVTVKNKNSKVQNASSDEVTLFWRSKTIHTDKKKYEKQNLGQYQYIFNVPNLSI